MATAQSIINRAGRLLGLLNAGEDMDSQESTDALEALNAMLDSWNNDIQMCYAIRDESLTLDGSQSYTVGSAGDLSTTRPLEVIGAYVVRSGTSYPVSVIGAKEYAAIQTKATQSDWPDRVYYEPSMSTGTLYVYPVGTDTSAVLHILTRTPLTSLSLSDTVTLPPGWEEALASNLAIAIAPEFQVEPRPSVIKMAMDSKRSIRRTNSRSIKGLTELHLMFGIRRSNIETDE